MPKTQVIDVPFRELMTAPKNGKVEKHRGNGVAAVQNGVLGQISKALSSLRSENQALKKEIQAMRDERDFELSRPSAGSFTDFNPYPVSTPSVKPAPTKKRFTDFVD
ncbi:hypothetical protein GF406_05480 [candidate division KSB1 bacterium]|nr:hypothetical protein [candidate division KSB1 bacterium]